MENYSTGTSYNLFLQMASKTLLPMRISHKVIYFFAKMSLFLPTKMEQQKNTRNLVKGARDHGKPVILTGCVPSADANLAKSLVGVSMLGVSQLDRVVEVVEQALQGHHATWKKDKSAGFQQVFLEEIGYHWFLFMIYQYICIYIYIYICIINIYIYI